MGICGSETKLDDKVPSVLCFSVASKGSLPKLKAVCGQISTRYLLWWARHTFPTDPTYFQIHLHFNNVFFFLFSFSLVFLYLSLHPCCFSCCSLLLSEKFCWVFFPQNYYLAFCVPERKQIRNLYLLRSKHSLYECVYNVCKLLKFRNQ